MILVKKNGPYSVQLMYCDSRHTIKGVYGVIEVLR